MSIFPRIVRKFVRPVIVLWLGSVALACLPPVAPGFTLDAVGAALAKSGNNGGGNGKGGGNDGGGKSDGGNDAGGKGAGGGNAGGKSDGGNAGGKGAGGNAGGNNAGGNAGGNNAGGNGVGSTAAPGGSPSGAATEPDTTTVDGVAENPGGTLRVVHRNGISETIRAGRYEMRDARGRVIVNRAATKRDLARLSRSKP